MKKSINLICIIIFVGISVFSMFGCAHAAIAKPDIPMQEQCVLVISHITGVPNSYRQVFFDGLQISYERSIVPAGIQTVTVSKRWQLTSGDFRTIYYEHWEITYPFQPGKYYGISLTPARVERRGNTFHVTEENVNVQNNNVTHSIGANIAIVEIPGESLGSIYISPIVGGNFGVAVSNGPARFGSLEERFELNSGFVFDLSAGPSVGLQIINGYLNTSLKAEASGFLGLVSADSTTDILLGYSYGGIATFMFPRFGFGLGGGMTGGIIWGSRDRPNSDGQENASSTPYLFPYAEINIDLRSPFVRDTFLQAYEGASIFTRYYFSDQNYFTIGLRARF